MSDFKAIIDAVKGIEATLVEKFGAEGRGLHEKLSSVEAHIPSNLQRSIRYLATLRNKAMHEEGYEIKDPAAYLRQAIEVRAQLLTLGNPAKSGTRAPAQLPSDSTATNKLLVILIAALMVGGAWFAADVIQSRSSVPATPVSGVSNIGPVEPAAQPSAQPRQQEVVQPPASVQRGHAPVTQSVDAVRPESTNNASRVSASSAQRGLVATMKEAISNGQSMGIGNDALRIDAVSFSPEIGSFRRAEPQITLTVTNISNSTVSNARAEAMLFINGQDNPSVHANELFVYLGQQGLRPGETRAVKVSTNLGFGWSAPDILNAQQRVIAARIASSNDGVNQAFGGSAPQLPWRVARPVQSAESGQVQHVDMRAQIEAGSSVGAGNAAVRLGTPTIKFGAGAFGRDIEISVEIENISQRTVSSVTADALLFLNGSSSPAVGDKEVIRFYLGEHGLAPGDSRQVRATVDRLKSFRWAVPDVMNAESRLIVLRVASTQDGMRNPFGGAAQPIPWEMPR